MVVSENAGVKVDSSGQNLDNNNNTASPDSDDRTNETAEKGQNRNGGCLKSEIKNLADAFSKLNPMAKEFVPPYLARSQSGVLRNGFAAAQTVVADGNDHLPRRRRSFGQGKRRMNKRTSLAQKEDVIWRTVYVSDIDLQVTEENLAGVFANCGQVVDCRVCGDPNSLLRFAFVEFTNEEGARAALSMSGTVLGILPS